MATIINVVCTSQAQASNVLDWCSEQAFPHGWDDLTTEISYITPGDACVIHFDMEGETEVGFYLASSVGTLIRKLRESWPEEERWTYRQWEVEFT